MPVDDTDPEGVTRVRAANPSPLTLDGTNTYIVERWVVDPGPRFLRTSTPFGAPLTAALRGLFLRTLMPIMRRGADLFGAPVVLPVDGQEVGPFRALGTPGHSADSVCLLFGAVCFTGDTVLGTGSVFIAPGEGSLSAYLDSLRRLRELDLG